MWILAQTKSKCEKTAELNIKNQGFGVFLPTIRRKKYTNSSWVNTTEMLFPGYIFINIEDNEDKIGSLNYTIGIMKVLIDQASGRPHILKQSLIDDININNINKISRGSKVNITKGTSVLSGIFLEKKGSKRAAILIEMLNNTREVLVDYTDIQPVYY
tara:strand:+ start:641 stop:1114 length:474 start_codon:yes stop_codon:yes gene_type:complete